MDILESSKVKITIITILSGLAVLGVSYVYNKWQEQEKIQQVSNFIKELQQINILNK